MVNLNLLLFQDLSSWAPPRPRPYLAKHTGRLSSEGESQAAIGLVQYSFRILGAFGFYMYCTDNMFIIICTLNPEP